LKENENGFFYIDGGRNDVPFIKPFFLDYISNFSTQCNCITAVIKQVPKQPIKFMVPKNYKKKEIILKIKQIFFVAGSDSKTKNRRRYYRYDLLPICRCKKLLFE